MKSFAAHVNLNGTIISGTHGDEFTFKMTENLYKLFTGNNNFFTRISHQ